MVQKRRRRKQQPPQFEDEIPYIPPRSEEQLLIEHLVSLKAGRILCTSHGRGQLAGFLASENPGADVCCHYLDSHYAALCEEYWAEADDAPTVVCSPDLPDREFDIVCIPVHNQGDAELTRDLMQQAYQRLKHQGTMYCAVNSPKDTWLHEQMQSLHKKVTRVPKRRGVIYSIVKTAPLKKERNFKAQFPVVFNERELTLETRPGVFSHRRLDAGAWALMKAMTVKDGMKVLDIGCGCGAVGIAATISMKRGRVTAIDSNARAVQCTLRNIELNLTEDEQQRIEVFQTHTGQLEAEDEFDLVLANPPYFSNFSIAKLFIDTARRTLKRRGRLMIVTKMPEWYEEYLPEVFRRVKIDKSGPYAIITATQ